MLILARCIAVLLVAFLFMVAARNEAAASDKCVSWVDMRNAIIMAANDQAPTSLGGYGETGGFMPHVVLFAMAAAETNWTQFDQNLACTNPPNPLVGGTNPPGWGLFQITVNRVDSDRYLLYNASHAAAILNTAWSNRFGTGAVIDNYSRNEIEDWLYAMWEYNGAACKNLVADSNNPRAHPQANFMNWSPSLGTRANNTYEDVVYYYIQNPPADSWSAGAPGASYYLTLYIGYATGGSGRGYPGYTSFPSSTTTCPTGTAVTTGLDYGYNYAFITQSFPTPETRGVGYSSYLQIRNTGNNVWYTSGAGGLRLGTKDLYENSVLRAGQDHASPFQTAAWISSSRPAAVHADTWPDAAGLGNSVGEFDFTMCPNCVNPADIATYDEYYDPVVDGTVWLPDIGIKAHVVTQ